jgi:hypothetical protein
MVYITKEEYDEWENEIISFFYDKKHKKTDLIPVNGKPSYLKQSKYIIVVNFNNIKKEVSKKDVKKEKLPKKEKITMYHIGDKKKGKVSYGFDEEDNVFKYPALDFGGLTNFKQEFGKTYRMSGSFRIDKDTSLKKLSDELHKKWKQLMKKKRFYGGIKEGILKWLQSLLGLLKENNYALLHFYKLPSRHRIIVTKDDILKATGNYYVRTESSDVKKYASNTNKEYYTIIQEEFINSNINKMNLLNEYSTY